MLFLQNLMRLFFVHFFFVASAFAQGTATPPDAPSGTFENVGLKASERNLVIKALMSYARSAEPDKGTVADFLALSLAMDPDNKEAMLVSYQIEKNLLKTSANPPPLDNAANNLVRVANKLVSNPLEPAQFLALHLFDAAIRIDPSNQAAPTARTELGKTVHLDWQRFYTSISFRAPLDPGSSAASKNPRPTPSPLPPANQTGSKKIVSKFPVKTVAKVNGLSVIDIGQHKYHGAVLEIIATQTEPEGSRGSATFLNRSVGPMMSESASYVYRGLMANYPLWRPMSVKFSFDNQFTLKDGPSASTAFALLLTSLEEGTELDLGVAVTGDMSADLLVRPIGGVDAKMKGALKSGCFAVGVPDANMRDVLDALILNKSDRLISKIQIFGMTKLDDAVALVRTDRTKELQEAIDEFKAVMPAISFGYRMTEETAAKVESVLKKAPNHLSAQILLAQQRNELPKTISLRRSLGLLNDIASPYLKCLQHGVIVGGLEPSFYRESLDRLDTLKAVADKESLPLVNRCQNIIRLWSSADFHQKNRMGGTGLAESIGKDFEAFKTDLAKILQDEKHASEFYD